MIHIGPHVSSQGSVSFAPLRAKELGATGFALFTKNQRQWRSPELKEEDISAFKKNILDSGYSPKSILPHAGYLINPASPNEEMADKSFNLFMDEGQRVVRLGLETINIHPGAYKEGSMEEGIKRCSLMVDRVLEEVPGLKIALENTAGAGTIIGSKFDELDAILSEIKNKDRVGFTLDTAHLFGAGYDVKGDPDGVLDSFFSRFGEDKLFGMHLNDSKVPLSSNKDRHESIGLGLIGKEAFLTIVKRREVMNIPLILETPDESRWKEEINELLGAAER